LHAIIIPDHGAHLAACNLGVINTTKVDLSGFVALKDFVVPDRQDNLGVGLTWHQHQVWRRCQIINASLRVPARNAQ
jgi:hypothetical protein